MDPKVQYVSKNFVVFSWEGYEITVYRENIPATVKDFTHSRGYHRPPNEIMRECYRIGKGILKGIEEKQKKKEARKASFVADLFEEGGD